VRVRQTGAGERLQGVPAENQEVRMRTMMKTRTGKRITLLVVVASLTTAACAVSSIDEVLIRPDARDVQKHSFAENKSRQISYGVDLKYPATALTDAHFAQLKKMGWAKCSGYREGWENFVDASKPKGQERTVFQNMSYWSKGKTLLTVAMRYDAGVTKDKNRLDVPDNTRQQVILLEDSNPGTKEWLKITCP
jgi:hypothetical protein